MVRTAPAQAVATRAHAQRHQHFHPSPSAPRLLIYLLATATLAPPRACTQHPPHPQQRTTNTTQHPSSLCGRPPRARNERSKRAIINCHSPRNSPMSAALTIDQPHSATPNDMSATPHSIVLQCECVCCRHSGVRSAGAPCGDGPLVRGDCVRSAERLDVVCRSGAVHCFAVECGVALVSLGVAECGWSIVSAADMGELRGE